MKINKKIDNVYHIEFGSDDDRANARIYRYDTGQLIKFYDIPDGVEVQFSNEHSTNGTINKRITDSMVQIPDSLLTSKDNIIAYIKYIDENSETTTKLIKFGLLDRAKPSDYVSPDEEPSFRSFVEEQLKEAKETVEKNKDYLKETIENTVASKEYMDATDANRRTVEGLTEKNKEYATQTESNAESANTSASNASESASNASQSASNAKGSADNASVSAKEAKDAAVKAGTSESNAKEAESNINSAVTEFEQTKRESLTEIGNLTTNSKKEISDLTDAKKAELNKINDNITQNAGELKEAIVNAADAKKEEINQKGLEVLQSIPEDMGKIQNTTLIKSTESGTEINLTDSSDMNIQELHFFGKSEQKTTKGIQLLNLKDATGGTGEGVTYTPNGDGSFKKTGTATGQAGNIWLKGGYYSDWENKTPIITLEVGKSYYMKDCAIFQGQTIIASGNGQVINVTEEKYPEGIKITGIRNTRFTLNKTYNEVIYPIIAESSTAVDWEEYTGTQPSPSPDYPQEMNCVKNPIINITGKNKVKEYLVNKTAKPYTTILNIDADLEANKEYSLSFIAPKGLWFYFNENLLAYNLKQATGEYQTVKLKTVATLSKDNATQFDKSLQKWIILKTDAKNTVVADFEKVQLEEGNVGTAYEEYKEIQTVQMTCELNGIDEVKDELIVRADGTGQLIQRLLEEELNDNSDYVTWYANTNTYGFLRKESKWLFRANKINIKSNKLKGITKEVGNPGTYDKNGIFVDVAGLYIKISKKYLTEYTVDALKTYLRDNPITVVGLLKEPIVTELSSEEVQKILALHTNKPNTTIWNDQEAEMQVTYVADTKSYIDNKFKELSDAIVASASEAE